jgi:hypothetical protein
MCSREMSLALQVSVAIIPLAATESVHALEYPRGDRAVFVPFGKRHRPTTTCNSCVPGLDGRFELKPTVQRAASVRPHEDGEGYGARPLPSSFGPFWGFAENRFELVEPSGPTSSA